MDGVNTDTPYLEFVYILAGKVRETFVFLGKANYLDGVEYNTYECKVFTNKSGHSIKFNIKSSEDNDRSIELLSKWLSHCYSGRSIYIILKSIHKNVLLDDIDLYVKITFLNSINNNGYFNYNTLFTTSELIKIYKNIPNLDAQEFMEKYKDFYGNYRLRTPDNLDIFELDMKNLSNSKISELWWMWKDYSNEHSTYIEWLPRETLDDFLMISNLGKYQPDYESYIEI